MAAERRHIVEQLFAVMDRVKAEIAVLGRIDLVDLLHDACVMFRRVTADIARSGAWRSDRGGSEIDKGRQKHST